MQMQLIMFFSDTQLYSLEIQTPPLFFLNVSRSIWSTHYNKNVTNPKTLTC